MRHLRTNGFLLNVGRVADDRMRKDGARLQPDLQAMAANVVQPNKVLMKAVGRSALAGHLKNPQVWDLPWSEARKLNLYQPDAIPSAVNLSDLALAKVPSLATLISPSCSRARERAQADGIRTRAVAEIPHAFAKRVAISANRAARWLSSGRNVWRAAQKCRVGVLGLMP